MTRTRSTLPSMGSISPYDSAQGRRYRVRFRKPDQTQTDKRGFRTKREAELFLDSVELDKARGGYIDPSRARLTIEQWMDIWLSSRTDVRATTRDRIEGIITKHVNPKLGHLPLGDLTRLGCSNGRPSFPVNQPQSKDRPRPLRRSSACRGGWSSLS